MGQRFIQYRLLSMLLLYNCSAPKGEFIASVSERTSEIQVLNSSTGTESVVRNCPNSPVHRQQEDLTNVQADSVDSALSQGLYEGNFEEDAEGNGENLDKENSVTAELQQADSDKTEIESENNSKAVIHYQQNVAERVGQINKAIQDHKFSDWQRVIWHQNMQNTWTPGNISIIWNRDTT